MAMSTSTKGTMANPNITPLIDVLLVLMIIFMIITPIVQKGFTTQVPPKAEPTANKPQVSTAIVLQMSSNGAMAINHTPVTMQELGDRLFQIYSTRPDKILFMNVDDKVPYNRVVKALDLAKGRAEVDTVGFVVN